LIQIHSSSAIKKHGAKYVQSNRKEKVGASKEIVLTVNVSTAYKTKSQYKWIIEPLKWWNSLNT
jgi:hypothetical protein